MKGKQNIDIEHETALLCQFQEASTDRILFRVPNPPINIGENRVKHQNSNCYWKRTVQYRRTKFGEPSGLRVLIIP